MGSGVSNSLEKFGFSLADGADEYVVGVLPDRVIHKEISQRFFR